MYVPTDDRVVIGWAGIVDRFPCKRPPTLVGTFGSSRGKARLCLYVPNVNRDQGGGGVWAAATEAVTAGVRVLEVARMERPMCTKVVLLTIHEASNEDRAAWAE